MRHAHMTNRRPVKEGIKTKGEVFVFGVHGGPTEDL